MNKAISLRPPFSAARWLAGCRQGVGSSSLDVNYSRNTANWSPSIHSLRANSVSSSSSRDSEVCPEITRICFRGWSYLNWTCEVGVVKNRSVSEEEEDSVIRRPRNSYEGAVKKTDRHKWLCRSDCCWGLFRHSQAVWMQIKKAHRTYTTSSPITSHLILSNGGCVRVLEISESSPVQCGRESLGVTTCYALYSQPDAATWLVDGSKFWGIDGWDNDSLGSFASLDLKQVRDQVHRRGVCACPWLVHVIASWLLPPFNYPSPRCRAIKANFWAGDSRKTQYSLHGHLLLSYVVPSAPRRIASCLLPPSASITDRALEDVVLQLWPTRLGRELGWGAADLRPIHPSIYPSIRCPFSMFFRAVHVDELTTSRLWRPRHASSPTVMIGPWKHRRVACYASFSPSIYERLWSLDSDRSERRSPTGAPSGRTSWRRDFREMEGKRLLASTCYWSRMAAGWGRPPPDRRQWWARRSRFPWIISTIAQQTIAVFHESAPSPPGARGHHVPPVGALTDQAPCCGSRLSGWVFRNRPIEYFPVMYSNP